MRVTTPLLPEHCSSSSGRHRSRDNSGRARRLRSGFISHHAESFGLGFPAPSIAAGRWLFCLGLASLFLSGCVESQSRLPVTNPATAIDPKTAEPGYWYDQPAVVGIDSPSFDLLWNACQRAAREDGFIPDRIDYRDGIITTQPLVSRQIFEPWKRDVVSTHALLESTLSTMRRTIRFEVHRQPTGVFRCEPKVLVERYAVVEHRITNETEYRDIFTLTRREYQSQLNAEHDPSSAVPPLYWYSVGRDPDLELQLAESVRANVVQAAANGT